MKINVNIIDAFEGPLHDRLRACWERYATFWASEMNLFWYPNRNGKILHQFALQDMWRMERSRAEQIAIITEHDFLPALSFSDFALTSAVWTSPLIAAEALRRNPARELVHYPKLTAPWYVRVDKDRVKALHFLPGGPLNDTANLMGEMSERWGQGKVLTLGHRDDMPRSFGAQLSTGTHLFWSRHYNDPPERVLCGYLCGDILKGVERAIQEWEETFNAYSS